jgi:hypothetical protein
MPICVLLATQSGFESHPTNREAHLLVSCHAFKRYCQNCEALIDSEQQSSWIRVKCSLDKCKHR